MSVSVRTHIERATQLPNRWFIYTIVVPLALLEADSALWTDEQVTARFVREMSLLELAVELPQAQPHLPLYYMLVDLWTQFGTMQSARLLSVAAAVLAVVFTHRLATRWFDTGTADLAALFVALSPTMLDVGHWLRMYALLGAFVTASWYCFDRAHAGDGRWTTWLAVTLPILYLHPFGLLAVVPMLAYGEVAQLLEFRRFTTRTFDLASLGATAAMVGPVAVVLGKLVGDVGVGTHHQMGHIPRPPGIHILGLTPAGLLFGSLSTVPLLVGAAAVTGTLGGAFVAQRYQWTRADLVCLLWILTPVIALSAVSYAKPVYQLKYLTWLTPAVAILSARTITRIQHDAWRSALATSVVLLQLYGIVLLSNGIARANFVFSWW